MHGTNMKNISAYFLMHYFNIVATEARNMSSSRLPYAYFKKLGTFLLCVDIIAMNAKCHNLWVWIWIIWGYATQGGGGGALMKKVINLH
jgi:hypothetical protein